MIIVLGDMNANIGEYNHGREENIRKQGVELMKENGKLFADICVVNKLVIGGSIFPHERHQHGSQQMVVHKN